MRGDLSLQFQLQMGVAQLGPKVLLKGCLQLGAVIGAGEAKMSSTAILPPGMGGEGLFSLRFAKVWPDRDPYRR